MALTTVPLATIGNTSLAAISTLMTNISSKNTTNSADNNKEETIKYNNMPKDACERCHLKNNPVMIITKR